MRGFVLERNHQQRLDHTPGIIFPDNHNPPGADCEEIGMRNSQRPSVRKPDGKRFKRMLVQCLTDAGNVHVTPRIAGRVAAVKPPGGRRKRPFYGFSLKLKVYRHDLMVQDGRNGDG